MEPALEHARSLRRGLVLPAAVAIAAAALTGGPARAECILQPEPAAPEGSHWSLHTDQGTNRRCWVLVESTAAAAAQPAPPPPQQPAPTTTLQSFFGNLVGANTAPAAAPEPPPQPDPAVAARKPARTAAAARPPAAPGTASSAGNGGGNGNYNGMTAEQREALFAAFLRWHDNRQTNGEGKEQPR